MVRTRLGQMILMGLQRLQDPYYQGFAAQVAFFYMLSIVPLIIVLSQLLNIFDLSLDFIQDIMDKYVSGVIGDNLNEWLRTSNNVTTNIVLVIVALWASSRAQFAITRITNYTMSAGRTTGKGYFEDRARSVLNIIITLVALTFALIVLVFGEQILKIVLDIIEMKVHVSYEVSNAWMSLRWLMAFALYFLMVLLNTYVSITEKEVRVRFKDIIPGAVFSALGMIVITLIYSKYTNYVMTAGNYNILYGSLASIAALLFWFYFLAWVQCLGTLFNKVWLDTRSTKAS